MKSEELRVKNLSLYLWRWAVRRMTFFTYFPLVFLSWPLIGKRDLNSSLFTLRSSLILAAKLQHSHCGSRMFCQLFSKFFSSSTFCCSVAVLQFSRTISHTQKILLYLYINIEINFDFYIIYFGTATLQHCNALMCKLLILSALVFCAKS